MLSILNTVFYLFRNLWDTITWHSATGAIVVPVAFVAVIVAAALMLIHFASRDKETER